jgi:glutathione S-transferase
MAKSSYKLTYYDSTGNGEVSRLIFALNDVKYEDERIPFFENFPALSPEWKKKLPWGQVPVLEVDGVIIAQSCAINRFLARRFDLVGNGEIEAAKCDEYVDAIVDFMKGWFELFGERDEAKQKEIKKNILETLVPKYLTVFNSAIAANGGKGLVGSKLTWADITMCHFLTHFETWCLCDYIKDYPAVHTFIKNFYELPKVKNWMATRPKAKHFDDFNAFNEYMKKMK